MKKKKRSDSQLNLLDKLIADNFCGGGGTSTGLELAFGKPVDIAINHDPDAILLHKTNHPYTHHHCESVWDFHPAREYPGRKFALAWFSPDCKHFSKASGGKPKDKKIRGLAWIVLRWAGTVRPDVLIVENVEEFVTWGPVRKGKLVKSKAGQTFCKWVSQLEALGYVVEWRELIAADYGTPTTRKRFFLIARCDGKPICWPEPTHAPADTPEVLAGKKKPWRSAAEIIDWSRPCPSIFATSAEIKAEHGLRAVRPLANNTMKRVARGLDKFVLQTGEPFLVPIGYGERKGQAPRVHDLNCPLPTTTSIDKHFVCAPSLIQVNHAGGFRGQELFDPMPTITGKHGYGLSAAYLAEWFGNSQTGLDITQPTHTQTSKDREALVLAHIVKFKGDNLGQYPIEPLQTITASAGQFGVVRTTLARADQRQLHRWPQVRELLNTYCGYDLAENEILLLRIHGILFFIADIGLRMLTPRELYAANGFPLDYRIERDYTGKVYPKTKQVARCGNAVPPQFAEALARANLPELCGDKITTMAEFHERVAV